MQNILQTSFDGFTVAAQIRTKMDARGLTLAYVSKRTGVDVSQISRFRKAKFKRGSPNLSAVCAFLGIDLEHESPQISEITPVSAIQALQITWNGTAEHEKALAQLIVGVGPLLLRIHAAK